MNPSFSNAVETKTPSEEDIFNRTKEDNMAIFSKYVITSQDLGQGAYASVFKGHLKSNPQIIVAVKSIKILKKPGFNEKLRREMTILMKFDHDNIVKLYDVAILDDKVFLFLEFCGGGDLNNRLMEFGGILCESEVLLIFKQVCEAMKQLYNNNIIHRDLKPANILIKDNTIKLTDFGFAREVFTGMNEASEFTRLGTPIYMSPQILNSIPFSSKTDIWSLGIMIYEMLYSKTPWVGKTPQDLLNHILKQPLKFIDFQAALNGSYNSPLVKKPPPITTEMKELLRKMLEITEEKRISWEDLFVHDIFKEKQAIVPPLDVIKEEKEEKKENENKIGSNFEKKNEKNINDELNNSQRKDNLIMPEIKISKEKPIKKQKKMSQSKEPIKKKGYLSMFCC